ncbi:bifunctional ADP-dependent NAD(P)H-hydrate dehydratase/NAD(P)H-hydrate epimerase [Agrobacterium vitis]|uniref:bifunctional ADP-dependent NAD(P)H-hydrate dehydratase/NAD(P)H-hydrate epimerase n=1 Tax=Rhizobium/Agrobacterium group TaxID=227290 RepID=UPI0008FB5881|nr:MULTISPECIES: bifunctional ADP-dependent NAD(P)H-hydrate dehydratase/NAD(P)H-hydrate epimerase [Rhizobium/Agrobacterium group]MCF1435160.1 bifunctional ADP-dependent NAD(P)H-hydrate dehydratase/NAD(P)H-hydrate epimerase [Allorhizobium ampelinum]MUO90567.1 bifunctional ADP-dependent NAD(P)H-hydrate dehydratase/NAD(P)H-hydrate epimerase [Agrobacterium vitis]MUZ52989.1 bifunctional ADP-dependent NAD(P)H-hydrate dehydratase/NAD(P)H-hydrate epimerase [Agrobacterium vitis]MUZ91208.1 bifunctional A
MMQTSFHHLISPSSMALVDRDAANSGIDSYGLMLKAGSAVAAAALRLFPQALRVAVLCGPGNNGGDGYVAAEALRQSGVLVQVFYLGEPEKLNGDAALAFADYRGKTEPLSLYDPQEGDLVVDALFGAGLARDLPLPVTELIERVNRVGIAVVAVDLPSGVDGRTGQPRPVAFQAAHTVTFMARKPGHVLLPGRSLCGTVEIYDIGIPCRTIEQHRGDVAVNHPDLWAHLLPRISGASHKFTRGHLTVFSGRTSATGAARLSAMAGLKAGAGLVTLASPASAVLVNATQTTAVMVKAIDDLDDLEDYLTDQRMSAFVLGPGFGIGEKAREFTLSLSKRRLVLDADGISSFRDQPDELFDAFSGNETRLVLTPHEGEFARLFADIAGDKTLGKVEKAQAAARKANAAVVYKGADTVIAAPDGRALINENAPPWLATAGSGDVLAGIIGGLLAQGVPAFEAAASGVWLHAETGARLGEGLTAEDLAAAVRPFRQG